MRLYEFADQNSQITNLVVAVDKLKTDLDNKEIDPNYTIPELLNYLKSFDIFIDKDDLFTLKDKMPLKNLIQNIQGENIIFKGFSTPEAPPEDEGKKIVSTMAKNAVNSPK